MPSLCLLFHAWLGSRASRGSTCPLYVSYSMPCWATKTSRGSTCPFYVSYSVPCWATRTSRGSTCRFYVSCSTPCWAPEPLGVPLAFFMSLIPRLAGLQSLSGFHLPFLCLLIHALLGSRASRGSTCPFYVCNFIPCWAPEPLGVPLALSMSLIPWPAGLQSLSGFHLPSPCLLFHGLLGSRASRGSTCPLHVSYSMACWAPEPLGVSLALSMSLIPWPAGLQSLSGFHLPSLCLLCHALLGSRASRGSTCPFNVSYSVPCWASSTSRGSTCPFYVSYSMLCHL